MEENLKNIELTIISFSILGFSTDAYIEQYPTISVGLAPLSMYCFEKNNEKTFLVAMHFLLTVLDADADFTRSVKKCWPYKDVKEKNIFKRAINTTMTKLIEKNLISRDIWKPSLLASSQGDEIWTVLRALSDIALNVSIEEFEEEEERSSAPPLQRAYSIDGQESYSMDELKAQLRHEFGVFQATIRTCIDRQDDQQAYLRDLERRLKKANKSIDASRKSFRDISQCDDLHVLSEAGRLQRSELVEKIVHARNLLQTLVESPLLGKSVDIVEHYKMLPQFKADCELLRKTMKETAGSEDSGGEPGGGDEGAEEVRAELRSQLSPLSTLGALDLSTNVPAKAKTLPVKDRLEEIIHQLEAIGDSGL